MAKILEFLKNIKPVDRKILIGFAIILGIYALAIIAVVVNSEYKKYQEKRAVQKWEESLRKPYKDDIYGGKTPEETWNMFLDALRKGDIELSSKYFAVENQEKYKKILEQVKQENKLSRWVKEMETLEKEGDQYIIPPREKAYYSYKYYNEEFQKEVWSSTVFYQNPLTKIWKILVL